MQSGRKTKESLTKSWKSLCKTGSQLEEPSGTFKSSVANTGSFFWVDY